MAAPNLPAGERPHRAGRFPHESLAARVDGLRLDLQGLRALAVALVVLWHAEVPGIAGGFIGVDVFFVISGFLMVRLLVGELGRRGAIRVGRFLYRRARRLLPAALLVLVVTAAASWWLLPVTALRSLGWDVVASTLYVANWRFAASEVDYLAAESLPSPVQHYWSLSVEEQFYLFLPLALLFVALIMRWARNGVVSGRRVGAVTLLALGVPSLVWSVVSAQVPDPADYFSTPQRVWELCLGGGVALLALRGSSRSAPPALRVGAVLAGFAGILASAVLITPAAAYPGWLALVPTCATTLIIWADGDDLAIMRPVGAGWVQWLGDRSYSVYLWHWPFLMLAGFHFHGSVLGRVLAVGAGLVLAELSWRFVEERFRLHSVTSSPKAQTITSPAWQGDGAAPAGEQELPTRSARADRAAARGARGAQGPSRSVIVLITATAITLAGGLALGTERGEEDLTPTLTAATDDRFHEFYESDCRPDVSDSAPLTCTFGKTDAETWVLVVGDSHAVMWMPGLRQVAEGNGWRLDLQAKLSCAPVDATIALKGRPYTECRAWTDNVIQGIEDDPPEMVILALSPQYGINDPEETREREVVLPEALGRVVERIRSAGPEVVIVAATPWFEESVPTCLASHEGDPETCQVHLPTALPTISWRDVAASTRGTHYLDMTSELCPADTCLTDADGILRWMDSNHLTATFSRSLAPQLEDALQPVLARR